jgi:hypothetical protein
VTPSVDLQTLIFNRLVASAAVGALVADRIYDNAPLDAEYPYLSFGPSDTVEADAEGITARIETVQIDCWARGNARIRPAKELADVVKKALHLYEGEMADHALVEMRVTLTRCFMDADGLTGHGVVQVSCIVEELDG